MAGAQGLIFLNEEDLKVFKLFLDWTYNGTVQKPRTKINVTKTPSYTEIHRLELELLQDFNETLKTLDGYLKYGTVFGPGLAAKIWEETKPGSALREFCIASTVMHLDRACIKLRKEVMMNCIVLPGYFQGMLKWLSRNFQLLGRRSEELVEKWASNESFSMSHKSKLCPCHFHVHPSTVASMWSTAALCRGRIFMHSYLLHPLLFSVRVAVSELQENLSRNPIFIVTQGISPRFTKFFSTTLLNRFQKCLHDRKHHPVVPTAEEVIAVYDLTEKNSEIREVMISAMMKMWRSFRVMIDNSGGFSKDTLEDWRRSLVAVPEFEMSVRKKVGKEEIDRLDRDELGSDDLRLSNALNVQEYESFY
ncbi:predicted protein [Sclerotinia sclerotiorum 1980 UF-70]|uniref:Uncharacterized protein n=1 Tax=Sclerotinia sclerotiorum (strain ATCC 18683 / 1980 / Ss-1) TaxID=665079 RepID=A7E9V0_SCLS1|nr:predicted protein [Sclerotinia sclerotiorum 1980 UF-70]EDN97152.1 predicted protein [Sclerotinia sclerotiorum 1980 UF-70]